MSTGGGRQANVLPQETRAPNVQESTPIEGRVKNDNLLLPLGDLLKQWGWQTILRDENRRSFMSYKPNNFTQSVRDGWFYQCINQIPWQRPWGHGQLLNRKACWLTTREARCNYKYGGTSWRSFDMPEWFLDLTRIVCEQCNIQELPNSCNANLYEHPNDCVGWHADDEPLFQADKRDTLIISLSLGVSRKFAYRPKNQMTPARTIDLNDGDICTMEELMQKYYIHSVYRGSSGRGSRINLTWRWVVS